LNLEIQDKLKQHDAILIPHGTLIAQMSSEEIESINVPILVTNGFSDGNQIEI